LLLMLLHQPWLNPAAAKTFTSIPGAAATAQAFMQLRSQRHRDCCRYTGQASQVQLQRPASMAAAAA
jgi:hypothetical protein